MQQSRRAAGTELAIHLHHLEGCDACLRLSQSKGMGGTCCYAVRDVWSAAVARQYTHISDPSASHQAPHTAG
jgi:hypothetical protein